MEAWQDFEEIPRSPFFTQTEEDYLVDQYLLQGFEKSMLFV